MTTTTPAKAHVKCPACGRDFELTEDDQLFSWVLGHNCAETDEN